MSASSDSLAALVKMLKSVYTTADLNTTQEINAAAGVIADSPSLQRALTDVAHTGEQRAELAKELFGSKLSESANMIIEKSVEKRWNSGADLVQGLETLGQLCAVTSLYDDEHEASDANLEQLETELLKFQDALVEFPELEQTLNNFAVEPAAKEQIVNKLTSKYSDTAQTLIEQAVVYPHGLRVKDSLSKVINLIANERNEFIATVESPVMPSPEQEKKLVSKLSDMYGRPIKLNLRINPSLVGGMRVRVGNDVMDGSVNSRVEGLRQHLTT